MQVYFAQDSNAERQTQTSAVTKELHAVLTSVRQTRCSFMDPIALFAKKLLARSSTKTPAVSQEDIVQASHAHSVIRNLLMQQAFSAVMTTAIIRKSRHVALPMRIVRATLAQDLGLYCVRMHLNSFVRAGSVRKLINLNVALKKRSAVLSPSAKREES
jgi:hypothetical protein